MINLNNWLKKKFIRWALKDIKHYHTYVHESSKNIFGLAGTDVFVIVFTEDCLFQSFYKGVHHKVWQCRDPGVVRESIFFGMGFYENWCDHNCSGEYGMLHVNNTYLFVFKEQEDAILFKLVHVEGNKLL